MITRLDGDEIPDDREDVTIALPDEDAQKSRVWADTIRGSGNMHRPDMDYNPDSYFGGYLGENALSQWFLRHGILYHHQVNLDGASAAPEFVVWRQGGPVRVDVKARTKPSHDLFLNAEHSKLDAGIYIGARIQRTTPSYVLRLMGWLERAEVEVLPPVQLGHGHSRGIEFFEMHRMHVLLRMLVRVLHVKGATIGPRPGV